MSKDFLDFIQDDDFVQWVKNPTRERNQYWQTWMEVHPEHVDSIEKARQLLLSLHFDLPVPKETDKQEVLENILRKTNRTSPAGTYSFVALNWNYLLKIAATFLIVMSSVFVVYKIGTSVPKADRTPVVQHFSKETPNGQRLHTVLPDGTQVWLNAGSKITWDNGFNVKDRVVTLRGEAFFDVAEDHKKPFLVISGPITTQAMGTSFNIHAYNDSELLEVALLTGKVKVMHEGARDRYLVLTSGQKAVNLEHSVALTKDLLDYRKDVGWREDLLYFQNAGYSEVKATLERWYGVDIQADSDSVFRWNYTGEFENQSLEMVLKRIAFTETFQFEIEGHEVTIYNN